MRDPLSNTSLDTIVGQTKNAYIKYYNYARNIFCFVVFVFNFAVAKNVFAGVFAASVFAVSFGTGAVNRKLQN